MSYEMETTQVSAQVLNENFVDLLDQGHTKASAHRITAASSARLQEEWLKLYPATFVGMTAAQAHTALLRETEKETT
jgi:hypothetical protein